MGVPNPISRRPVCRQLTGGDPLGRGRAAKSPATAGLRPRTATSDRVVQSVWTYCTVGCGQQVYVKDDRVVQIEGDPDSPISRGQLCPKGSATLQLTTGPSRRHQVPYRRPYASDWEPLDLEKAMDMVADREVETRRRTWEWEREGVRTARTLGIASLGGATTFMQDLQESNFAEAHPVGVPRVMEAKARLYGHDPDNGVGGDGGSARVLTAAGAVGAALPGRRRGAGLALLAGSARTRFGIFAAGIASAEDPVHTVGPQRGDEPHNAERKEPR